MNRKTLLPIIAAALLVACDKDETTTPNTPGSGINKLAQVFANNVANATQDFTVDAATGGTIYGNDGARVTFFPNAFLNGAGDPVSGTVNVSLVEANSIGMMLWLNKQTVGNDNGTLRYLKSGGEIRLTAQQNGSSLRLAPNGSQILIPYPDSPDPDMELFAGTEDAEGNVIWDPFGNPNQGPALDTLGYMFPNDSIGWINCDYFWDWPGQLTDVDIVVPSGYDDVNTIVWVVFPWLNSLASVHSYSNGVFTLSGGYQVPVGEDITIVSLHDNGNNTYTSSFTTVTTTNNFSVTPTYQATTLAQFEQDCMAL